MTSSAAQVIIRADADALTLWPSIDKRHLHVHGTETHTSFFTITDSQKHKRKRLTCTHRRSGARFCFVWPLDFEFMSVVRMHRHAALLIRTVHITSAVSFSPSVYVKTLGRNHSLHHSLFLSTFARMFVIAFITILLFCRQVLTHCVVEN